MSKNKKSKDKAPNKQEQLSNYVKTPEAQYQNQDHNSHKEPLGPNTNR